MPKLGKLPVDNARPALRFSTALAGASVPAMTDEMSRVSSWPMFANDRVGDCTCAALGHTIEADTTYAQGNSVVISEQSVLTAYSAVSGYDPKTGANDNGAYLQDVMSYWRKTGVEGHKIVAYAKLDPHNHAEVAAAIYYFGHIIYGFSFPNSAWAQFDAGEPWDVVSRDGGIDGGHAVNVGFYDSNAQLKKCVTWGAVQPVTDAFLDKYADEAWVPVTKDWLDAAQQNTPAGLDLAAWGKEWVTLTGEPNPFPDAPPQPVPTPDPVPTPVPGPDAADAALAPLMHRLSKHHWHHITFADAAVIDAWLADKGYV